MKIKSFAAAAMLSGSLVMATNANAQSVVDVDAVTQACSTSAAACNVAIRAALAALQAAGLPAAQLNAQIAALTGAAIAASQSLPAAQRAAIAPALFEAAALSTDPVQIASLQTVASQIQAGSPVTLAPVAQTASPS